MRSDTTPKYPPGAPTAKQYTLYHRTCGHPIAIHTSRDALRAAADATLPIYRHALRIRTTRIEDPPLLAQGLSCNMCRGLIK